LVEPKNFADLIKAFQISVNAHPEWSLEIYGRGPQHSELKKLIAELEVGQSVSILKPSSDFREHLSNAAMHVSSSKFESFGLTLAEAMSYGVPVVSQYNHIGAKFLLEDGRGQLADLPNAQSVADLISKNMGMIEKGDPDNVLRRQVEKAYLFSKTISEENALGLWKDSLDQGIQQKLLAE
jgi:glycosyltransferase involved in cell wall biosynthesis